MGLKKSYTLLPNHLPKYSLTLNLESHVKIASSSFHIMLKQQIQAMFFSSRVYDVTKYVSIQLIKTCQITKNGPHKKTGVWGTDLHLVIN